MPARVTLTITAGPCAGQQFVFDERGVSILGRASDCHPRVRERERRRVSRHHCLLDVNPPDARVRDFGSLNGTFVNGQKIGQRPRGTRPEQADRDAFPEHDLKEGDEIRLGDTVFRVSIFVPAQCAGCSIEIPEDDREAARRPDGSYQCANCRQPRRTGSVLAIPAGAMVCVRCGKDVSAEMGGRRGGEFVCAACKANPYRMMRDLLQLAVSDDPDLVAIKGYQVIRELGRGGMGAVYLARHEKAGNLVALKVLLPQVALNDRARRHFLREIDFTRGLRHGNVVRLHDAGCSRGVFFLTLEYCDGDSVHQLMKQRGGPLPIAEAAAIILQVLDGLQYAHNAEVSVTLSDGSRAVAAGLVHRDVKPQNVFLSGGKSPVAKVGDYGLAKAFDLAGLSGLSATGAAAGTPCFLPRQQVVDFKYARPEVDVWAAAASLYYMLTGRYPRDFPPGKDPWQVVLQDEPVPIRRRERSIPQRLAEVIDVALREKPGIPFQTPAALKAALTRVL
jgi:serine/threonine-protein kinase